MTSKEFFVTGVRLFGVWHLLQVIEYAVAGFNQYVGIYVDRNAAIGSFYTVGATHLLTGLYMLGGAPHIVRFFFPSASIRQSEPATPPDA